MKHVTFRFGLGAALLVLAACAPAASPAPTVAKPATTPTAAQKTAAPTAKTVQPSAAPSVAAPQATAASKPSATAFDEKAVADFYRGKTVRLIVGYAPGGGYDTYARLIARYLGKYIPGEPTVIVENMTGAGGILAANYVYASGPKDGTVVGNIAGSLAFEQLFDASGVQFDIVKFHHVGAPVQENLVMLVPKSRGITSLQDVLRPNGKQVVMGGISGSTSEYGPALMRDVIGANIKLITGYAGTSAIRLAMDSGEVDGLFNVWQSVKTTNKAEVDSGEWRILAQMTDKPIPDLPQPNVPTIIDIAKTEEQKQLLLIGTAYPNQFSKLYIMAPETPADRGRAVNAAFLKALADPELLVAAGRANLEITPLGGEDTLRLARETMDLPAGMREKLRPVMKPG